MREMKKLFGFTLTPNESGDHQELRDGDKEVIP